MGGVWKDVRCSVLTLNGLALSMLVFIIKIILLLPQIVSINC
jgi:hypothetical protein